ncbi:MAG: pitrilysin family protein [Acidobacteriota bacterium]
MKKLSVIFFILLTFFVRMMANSSEIKIPEWHKKVLKNGVKLVSLYTEKIPMVSINLIIPSGSALDPPGKEGLARLTARMLLKGTKNRDEERIAFDVEFLGGSLETYSSQDYSAISAEFMSKDVLKAIEIFFDVLLNPIFPEEEFKKEKERAMDLLKQEKDNPSLIASKEFFQFLFKDHPYAHSSIGSEETIEKIKLEDAIDFYKKRFIPNGSVFVIVGNFDKSSIGKIENSLNMWKDRKTGLEPIKKLEEILERRILIVDDPDQTQSQIRIGRISFVSKKDPDFPAAVLANTILGGGFTSRLVNEVRVNRGLTYGINSSFVNYKSGGVFLVSTFTKNKSTLETIKIIIDELKKFKETSVTDAELEGAKNYITGQFPRGLETNNKLASQIGEIEFFNYPPEILKNFLTEIKKVTKDDIQRVSQKHFDLGNFTLLVLSNAKEVEEDLKELGKYEVKRMK